MDRLDSPKLNTTALMLALVMMLMMIPIANTAAYYMNQTVAENYIQFGSLDLDLIETTLDENGQEVPFDTVAPFDVTTDATQSRIVRVKNIGPHAMFIRVQFHMEGVSEAGDPFDADQFTQYTLNLEDWIYSDGWYYYPLIVQPGESTTELFTQVIFEVNGLSRNYPGCNLHLSIYAQGVQSEHQETTDVMLVTGWPEEVGK